MNYLSVFSTGTKDSGYHQAQAYSVPVHGSAVRSEILSGFILLLLTD